MEDQNKSAEETTETGTVETTNEIIAVIKPEMSLIIKGSSGSLNIIQDKEAAKEKLKELVDKHKKDLDALNKVPRLKKEQLEEVKKIRAEFREARYTLQNINSNNTTVLNAAGKNHKLLVEDLINVVKPSEDLADTIIKGEEEKKKKEAEEAAEKEALRIEGIQNRIKETGEEFEKMLSEAKENRDFGLFDALFKSFEGSLDTLDEFGFDGQDLLDRMQLRKEDIQKAHAESDRLAEEKKLQEEKSLELNSKERELNEKQEKLEEEKRRFKVMFSFGFMFNGSDFVKGDVSEPEETIYTKSKEEFETYISDLQAKKDQEEKEAAEAKAEKERQAKAIEERSSKYLSLLEEANTLKLDASAFTDTSAGITEEMVTNFTKHVETFKTEQGKKAEEERQAKAAEELKGLQEAGQTIFDAIAINFAEMKGNVMAKEILNEDVKNITLQFFADMTEKVNQLKKSFKLDQE